MNVYTLHNAVGADDFKLVHSLLICGANPNEADERDCLPLFYCKSIRVAGILIRFGANPSLRVANC